MTTVRLNHQVKVIYTARAPYVSSISCVGLVTSPPQSTSHHAPVTLMSPTVPGTLEDGSQAAPPILGSLLGPIVSSAVFISSASQELLIGFLLHILRSPKKMNGWMWHAGHTQPACYHVSPLDCRTGSWFLLAPGFWLQRLLRRPRSTGLPSSLEGYCTLKLLHACTCIALQLS
jgi:hypothetical protein